MTARKSFGAHADTSFQTALIMVSTTERDGRAQPRLALCCAKTFLCAISAHTHTHTHTHTVRTPAVWARLLSVALHCDSTTQLQIFKKNATLIQRQRANVDTTECWSVLPAPAAAVKSAPTELLREGSAAPSDPREYRTTDKILGSDKNIIGRNKTI